MITGRPQRLVQDIQLKDLPHRHQFIVRHDQMVFINDSKATNLTALKFALNKMSNPYVLILCGDPYKEQYESYEIDWSKKGLHFLEIMQKKYLEKYFIQKNIVPQSRSFISNEIHI